MIGVAADVPLAADEGRPVSDTPVDADEAVPVAGQRALDVTAADAADVAEGGADIEANVEDAEEDAAMDGTTNATSCFLTTLYLDCRTLR